MDKIKIKKIKPMKLAYIEHIGEYSKVPYDKYVPRLFEWAKENKVRPGFKNINVFHDDPEEKNPSECKSWVGIPINGDTNPDDEVKIKDFPELQVATLKFKGPASEYRNAYGKIKAIAANAASSVPNSRVNMLNMFFIISMLHQELLLQLL